MTDLFVINDSTDFYSLQKCCQYREIFRPVFVEDAVMVALRAGAAKSHASHNPHSARHARNSPLNRSRHGAPERDRCKR